MDGALFISYSRIDSGEVSVRLADELEAGPPVYAAWIDARKLQAGQEDWDRQLVEAIKTCAALVFVMSEDSVRDESGCKPEWVAALRYKKPIVPVRMQAGVELPFRLSSRQFIDFSESFDTGMAALRRYLAWRDTPAGVLEDLRHRLADAEYGLPRASREQRARIVEDISELRGRIEKQLRVVQSPALAAEKAEARIEAAIEREREPEHPAVESARAKFVNPPPMTPPAYFQDRHVETELIAGCLREDGMRLLWVVGRGGVGKTAMVCRLLQAVQGGRLPDELGELAVDGIVYLSPLGHPVNFPNLFGDLCRLLAKDVAEALRARYRDAQQTPAALMRALLEAFPAGRTVVLMDNFEELVDAEATGLTDAALDEALRALLSAPAHGVRVIITTRVAPRGLRLTQPGAQQTVGLEEGLASPFAEEVLRARDPAGRLGVRDAPDELLGEARKRTRGFPRALEALVAILAADRDTTLPELLASSEGMPENVTEALVGEAFSRLDGLSQQVMQALAIYGSPVPPVAVDYLLQPFRPVIDSAPVLSRLVNMTFARRDAGHYYLHQVDRDYALHRVPVGDPSDHDSDLLLFTQHALRNRAADYFQQTRTPRETWRNINDLAPQLAEFELRCQTAEYDTAAQVLFDIDVDYLMLWGNSRLVLELHQRLQGHVTDRWTSSRSKGALGGCYAALGQARRAIEFHEQALAIHREMGDRQAQGADLSNLGLCYSTLGETRRAIELAEQALAISREVGDRQGESVRLGNLGLCYRNLGETRRAIELHEQANAIRREIGDREGEGFGLANLGGCYAALGDTRRAIELHEEALAISREIGHRQLESGILARLGECYTDLAMWEQAEQYCELAIQIADETEFAQARSEGRLNLATAQLHSGALDAALQTVQEAPSDDPRTAANLALIAGIVLARQDQRDAAHLAFTDAVRLADALLEQAKDNYRALDVKALALCGLLANGGDQLTQEACSAFRAARTITNDKGTVERILRLLDALGLPQPAEILEPIRQEAAGHND